MSSTNKTANFNLTQFLGSDVPSWLTDYNGDMAKIDAGMTANQTAAATAQATATGANSKADTAIANAAAVQALIDTPNTGLADRVSDVEGDVNTIQSLIGNGEPTTTDKTIIGAINELNEEIGQIAPSGDVEADDVIYDNTTSGLTATRVQAAIDELAAASPSPTPATRDKKVIVIADSYGMRNTPNFCSILEALDSNVYTCDATSGSGYTRSDWYDRITAIASNMSSVEKAAVTDILFCGGWNDAWQLHDAVKTLAELKARIVATHAHARSLFPNAICHPVFMAWQAHYATQNSDVDLASLLKAREAYFTADAKASPFANIEYIMRDITNMDNTYFHPNADAAQKFADAINAYIYNGDYNYSNVIDFTTGDKFKTGSANVSSTFFKAVVTNGITRLKAVSTTLSGSGLTGGIVLNFKPEYFPFVIPSGVAFSDFASINNGTINGTSISGPTQLLITFSGTTNADAVTMKMYYNGAAVTSIAGAVHFDVTMDNTQCV